MTQARFVYVVASAAPPVRDLGALLGELECGGWRTGVILTPTAASWVDVDALAKTSGSPVRSYPRMPWEQDPLPPADAVLAAPSTFNTLNKWASGIADTLAVGLLCELLGAGVPITAAPCVKSDLRRHPAYQASIDRLAEAGAHFLDPDAVTYRGPDGLAAFHWATVASAMT